MNDILVQKVVPNKLLQELVKLDSLSPGNKDNFSLTFTISPILCLAYVPCRIQIKSF